ncbi:hypothetical protein LTR72_008056 [Exophiala xenobiotica]|nr:hypothetical protein LTR72_008056 [Exophiala xenobiotica]KAK5288106.1 hypothetical protein LTR14_008443 [Exophiala xenobiotica]KAK5321989.1 hypothetical protein LTR93_006227 [Exophiala xenobiotica]KAK5401958.1 hypothetical protein LTR06_010659 [Exophiala xenobiotica]KAK5477592.1 hypothetical protein LTR55_008184 [Exophiala xenobiotica]
MPLGVLQYNGSRMTHVPGTVLLDMHDQASEDMAGVKRGEGKDSEVILVPQPSSDPNDPLNWPLWQRDLILLLYCYCTLLCIGGVGPIISPMAVPLIEQFHIGFTQVSLLLGYNLVAVGAVGVAVSACARKYGKRPMLLWSISTVLAGTIWASRAMTYNSMVGARVFQGLGLAMFESVTFTLIGDLYFVHQRGSRMAFYVVCQSGLANLPGVVAGKVTMDMGWRWAFYLVVVFLVVAWFACVMFGWETCYNRDSIYNIDTSSQDNLTILRETKGTSSIHTETAELSTTISARAVPGREPVLQRLKPYHGTYSDEPLWRMILKPFFVLLNPIASWSILIVSFASLWVIAISLVVAQIFSAPPYLFNTAEVGYISAGPMVGGFAGCALCGLISDPIARWLTRKNKGVYEPEFRLPMMILVPVVSAIGYFSFGGIITEGKSAVAAAAMWGVTFVAVQVAAVSTGAYIVDAFRDISVEIFIISMSVKNFLWFGFSCMLPLAPFPSHTTMLLTGVDFLNDWYASAGAAGMFYTIGGIQVALSLTTIPVYIFGKRLRAWWHVHNVLDKASN